MVEKVAKPATPKSGAKAAARKPVAKAAQAKAASAKPAPAKPRPDHSPLTVTLKLKDLVEQVVESTSAKRNVVKPIVSATLAAIGQALSAGEALILPPLGRARVSRSKEGDKSSMLTVKLKRKSAAQEALAKATDRG